MPDKLFSIDDLLFLMERLRDPISGCPWDIKQTFNSIIPYTLEEVYEVVDAIENRDFSNLKEELGDLLFQIIFYCNLADEKNLFSLKDVISSVVKKLISRHPHVFPDGTLSGKSLNSKKNFNSEDIKKKWEVIKLKEREKKGQKSILADIPVTLPSLMRAQKIQKRAATFGFDWKTNEEIFNKVYEEVLELSEAIEKKDKENINEELGDLIFTIVNLCRHLDVDAEVALRGSSKKFERRFNYIEAKLDKEGGSISDLNSELLEKLWSKAKKHY
jgi:ATP diphosphatase